jgi:hypothetical protein
MFGGLGMSIREHDEWRESFDTYLRRISYDS